MNRRTAHQHRGFSFVEMLIVLSILSAISAALFSTIVSLYRTNSYTLEQAYEVSHARRGVERTVRDIREMTYGDNGAYPLVDMGTSSLGFYSDIDRDQSVEFVRYELTGTTIYKYIYNATGTPLTYSTMTPDSTEVISEYVRNAEQVTPVFRYFTEAGTTTPAENITDVRYIGVTAIINVDPNRNPGEYTLWSTAAPRNLKTSF